MLFFYSMIRIKRKTIREQRKAIAFLFAQVVLVILFVYQLLYLFGLRVFSEHPFRFSLSREPIEYVLLAFILVLIVAMYFAVKKKQPALFAAQKMAGATIKQAAKQKILKAKDQQATALFFIQLMFVAAVVIAAYAFFEPDFELIPWEEVKIYSPVTTYLNAIVAIVVIALFYWLYRYTAWYRKK